MEKRGKGRPRKDEVVIKEMKVHRRPQITEANKLKYAEQTIKNAEKIYDRLEGLPDPLNIDLKDLTREAKEIWNYIFSLRDNNNRKRINAFDNPHEVIYAFEGYCRYIKKNGYMKSVEFNGETKLIPIVPNMTNFAEFLGIHFQAVNRTLSNYPEIQKEYKMMLSDLISEGSMIGAYAGVPAIFALKNQCDWADKREDRVITKNETLQLEEAKKALEELGYTRPRLLESRNE